VLLVALLYTEAAVLTVACLLSSDVTARLLTEPLRAAVVLTLPLPVGIAMFGIHRRIGSRALFGSRDR
jgi:hypothetical protein